MASFRQCNAGFALLEALVALAILAGAAASVMTLIAANRRAQADAGTDIAAAFHARTLLARIGRDLPLQSGTLSGTFDDGLVWSLHVTPFMPEGETASSAPALFQVQVLLQDKLHRSVLEVSTLRRPSR